MNGAYKQNIMITLPLIFACHNNIMLYTSGTKLNKHFTTTLSDPRVGMTLHNQGPEENFRSVRIVWWARHFTREEEGSGIVPIPELY